MRSLVEREASEGFFFYAALAEGRWKGIKMTLMLRQKQRRAVNFRGVLL